MLSTARLQIVLLAGPQDDWIRGTSAWRVVKTYGTNTNDFNHVSPDDQRRLVVDTNRNLVRMSGTLFDRRFGESLNKYDGHATKPDLLSSEDG